MTYDNIKSYNVRRKTVGSVIFTNLQRDISDSQVETSGADSEKPLLLPSFKWGKGLLLPSCIFIISDSLWPSILPSDSDLLKDVLQEGEKFHLRILITIQHFNQL